MGDQSNSWNNTDICYADIINNCGQSSNNSCGQSSNNPCGQTSGNGCNVKHTQSIYCNPNAKIDNDDGILTCVNPKLSIKDDKTFELWGDGFLNKGPTDSQIPTTLDFSILGDKFPLNCHGVKCVDGIINTAPAALTEINWVTEDASFNGIGSTPFNGFSPDIATDTVNGNFTYVANVIDIILPTAPGNEILVFKLNGATGAYAWSKRLTSDPGYGQPLAASIQPSICTFTDGSIVLVAYTGQETVSSATHIQIVALNGSDGTLLWNLTSIVYNNVGFDQTPCICMNYSNTYAYLTYSTNGASVDPHTGPNMVTNASVTNGTFDIVVAQIQVSAASGKFNWVRQNDDFNYLIFVSGSLSQIGVNECDDVFVVYQASPAPIPPALNSGNIIVAFILDNSGNFKWIKYDNTINASVPVSPATFVDNIKPVIAVSKTSKCEHVFYISYATSGTFADTPSADVNNSIVVLQLDSTSGTTNWHTQSSSFNALSGNNTVVPAICTDYFGQFVVGSYQTNGHLRNNTNIGPADVVVFILDHNGNTVFAQQNPNPIQTWNTTMTDLVPRIVCDGSLDNIFFTFETTGQITYGTPTQLPAGFNTAIVVCNLLKHNTSGSGIITLEKQCSSNPVFDVLLSVPYPTDQGPLDVNGNPVDPAANIIPFTFLINGMIC